MFWTDASVVADSYRAFRGIFRLKRAGKIELRLCGASWYGIWVGGNLIGHGPARHHLDKPAYDAFILDLDVGEHLIALQLQHVGVATRMLAECAPWMYVEILENERVLAVNWKIGSLISYRSQVRRINPQLGWCEWRDTRIDDDSWRERLFDDSSWQSVAPHQRTVARASDAPPPLLYHARLAPHEQGVLTERFGYELDDPPLRFLLRDLAPSSVPAQGVWRRYDLGRIRLGMPRLMIDAPAGSVVEFAYAEMLSDGRVAPAISLSLGLSCNFDHYMTRGGIQEFMPLTPKGGRWLEVHVLADPATVRIIDEIFIERSYHRTDETDGSFTCDDDILTRCWEVGVETYRACSEDVIVDNPTRERGAWLGDAVVAVPIVASAFSDLRVCRRALIQPIDCANDAGVVAGLYPGTPHHLSSYALHWVEACVQYFRYTDDRAFLEEIFSAAQRNLGAFAHAFHGDGLRTLGWAFIDWGYAADPAFDLALHLHYLGALTAMMTWCTLIGETAERNAHARQRDDVCKAIRSRMPKSTDGNIDWERAGYHVAALALRHDLVESTDQPRCIAAIKRHLLDCFPNNPSAPRLSDPSVHSRRIITPYFAHHAFPALIEHGEMAFVLDQFRTCWGWWLAQGGTTWMEVFDPRWSHCHQWSGCPTWQLTRYALGLEPRFDLGPRHYYLHLYPGSLQRASGRLPIPNNKAAVYIAWKRHGTMIEYCVSTTIPIWIHHANDPTREVVGDTTFRLPVT